MDWPIHGRFFCLLHVFWFLHIVHLVLAVGAVWPWPAAGSPPHGDRLRTAAPRLAAWCLLGGILLAPGVNFEFPSDNWAHYVRIFDFSRHVTLAEIPTWTKSSYFLAYSFTALAGEDIRPAGWLSVWYVASCLLLCWQYYRFARSFGLSERTAYVSVLLQALLLGYNLFGFYRYYGLSSALWAQIGALALIRLGQETLRAGLSMRSTGRTLFSAALLATLIAFTHIQGLAIAGIGLLGVLIADLAHRRKPGLLGLLLAGIVVANVLAFLRLHGVVSPANSAWLNPWLGFDLVSMNSPAFDRMVQVLGLLGAVNLLVGALLAWKKDVVGWVTVMPVLVLVLPVGAMPFVAGGDAATLPMFFRLLLAIPPGLAAAALAAQIWAALEVRHASYRHACGFAGLPLVLAVLTLAPAGRGGYNRLWHALVRPADDLSMAIMSRDHSLTHLAQIPAPEAPLYFATPGLGFVASAAGVAKAIFQQRWMTYPVPEPPAVRLDHLQQSLRSSVLGGQPCVVQAPSSRLLFSPYSTAGFLSGHWLPSQVALELAGGPEIQACALALGGRTTTLEASGYFNFPTSAGK